LDKRTDALTECDIIPGRCPNTGATTLEGTWSPDLCQPFSEHPFCEARGSVHKSCSMITLAANSPDFGNIHWVKRFAGDAKETTALPAGVRTLIV